jgi:hypothetical protein
LGFQPGPEGRPAPNLRPPRPSAILNFRNEID